MLSSLASSSTGSDSTTSRSRTRWLVRGALGLLLALVVVDLVALQLARSALRRAAERVEAEGSSLDAYALLPEVEAPVPSAHSYLEAAGEILETLAAEATGKSLRKVMTRRIRQELRFSDEPPTAEDLELFRRGLDHYHLVLDIVDTARPIERAEFVFDRQAMIREGYLPGILRRLRISDLLGARIRVATAEGRTDEAWRDVVAMFRLATWTSQEVPTLVHQLIATALVRYASLESMALLREDVPDPEVMREVVAAARGWNPGDAYTFAMEVDRAAVVTSLLDERVLEQKAQGEVVEWYPEMPAWLLSRPLRPWWHWNLAMYSDTMTKLFADCRRPVYLREEVVAKEGRLEELYPLPRWAALASGLLTENYFDACNKRDRTLVNLDFLELAFQLEAHRRQTGSYPASLDVLPGSPRVDPFSGAPYVYRLVDGGASIYSFGLDRDDDGGTPHPFDSKRGEDRTRGDLVWRLGE